MTTGSDAGWDNLDTSGVEVGDTNKVEEAASEVEAPKAEEAPKVEAAEESADGEATEESADGEENADEQPKKKSNKDYQIDRLKKEKAELARKAQETEERLAALEARLTPPENQVTSTSEELGPDHLDVDKYPLGILDPQFQRDSVAFEARRVINEQKQADLHRQQEEAHLEGLYNVVDTFVTKGTEIDPDYREKVVEAGFRGEWELGEPTFQAAAEADNGAQIMYELATNPEEAARVAALPPFKQLQYVAKRDLELSQASKPRIAPKAGEPPKHNARGTNSRVKDNPATDDLDDFGRQFDGL